MKIFSFLIKIEVRPRFIHITLLICQFFLVTNSLSQKIIAGPIQGETTDSSVTFWILVKNVTDLSIIDNNSMIKFNQVLIKEDSIVNKYYKKLKAFKYKITFSHHGSSSLHYGLMLNNELFFNFNFTVLPDNNSFLFGSCAYIGKGFSKGYRPWNMTKIYKTMAKETADHMIWMGDNLYLTLNHDLKNKFSIYRRYLGVRKDKGLNAFLSSNTPHYSTWDDHDFGPNNSDGSFKNSTLTTDAFLNFWPNPNPVNDKGIYYSFRKGDVEFFMTDSRTFRNNNGSSLLGLKQLDWLKNELLNSTATFKFIIISNQVINQVKGHESYYDFPNERKALFNFIKEKKIPGILFLSGDRHHSEVQVEDLNYPYPIYDITCSALSSPRPKFRGWGPEGDLEERMPGSFITKHNYGKCIIQGENENKKLLFKYYNYKMKELFTFSVHMKELGY